MATKTITLTGAEVAVTGLDGSHAHIRNDSTDTIYAAKTAGITAGADGVASIPAGQADTLRGISGAVYLLGTGSALIQSDDYVESPFKTSAQSSGSGADEVARAAISSHAGNAEIHVNAEGKAAWNGLSNPNLLINPDFSINQRGNSSYSGGGYTVDRWSSFSNTCTVTLNDKGVSVSDWLFQMIDEPQRLIGKEIVISALVKGNVLLRLTGGDSSWANADEIAYKRLNTGDEFQIIELKATIPENASSVLSVILQNDSGTGVFDVQWVKLELGSVATPFTPPDPATELAKCQRYYQIRSTGDIAEVDLRPTMRNTPTITQLSDGNYAYSAEL